MNKNDKTPQADLCWHDTWKKPKYHLQIHDGVIFENHQKLNNYRHKQLFDESENAQNTLGNFC